MFLHRYSTDFTLMTCLKNKYHNLGRHIPALIQSWLLSLSIQAGRKDTHAKRKKINISEFFVFTKLKNNRLTVLPTGKIKSYSSIKHFRKALQSQALAITLQCPERWYLAAEFNNQTTLAGEQIQRSSKVKVNMHLYTSIT